MRPLPPGPDPADEFVRLHGLAQRPIRAGSPEALALARHLRLRLPPAAVSKVLRARIAPGYAGPASRPGASVHKLRPG